LLVEFKVVWLGDLLGGPIYLTSSNRDTPCLSLLLDSILWLPGQVQDRSEGSM